MANHPNRYKEMETRITYTILADTVLFVLYLIVAAAGIIWLKVVLALLTLALAGFILYTLYMSKELFRRRSLWMTTAAGAIAVCIFFSLILNFPSPKPELSSQSPETNSTSQAE